MKTFTVVTKDSEKVEAEQLATLTFYVSNIQFRFVVTKMPGQNEIAVTERESGKRACTLTYDAISRLGYVEAAKAALTALVTKYGEARVRSVLAGQ